MLSGFEAARFHELVVLAVCKPFSIGASGSYPSKIPR